VNASVSAVYGGNNLCEMCFEPGVTERRINVMDGDSDGDENGELI